MAALFHIIGAGRGGTSLLAGLLDAHPDCEVVPEALSLHHLMETGLEQPPGETLSRRVERRVGAFLAACEASASQSTASLWGHKSTTEQIKGLEAPEVAESYDAPSHFACALAGTPVVLILRDGRTCIPSKVRRTGQPLALAIERWKFSITMLELFRRDHDRLHVLRMEDLVRDPATALTATCRFLGLDYDPHMLAGTMSDKMLPEYRRSGFDLAAVEVTDDPPWIDLIANDLRRAGY